jgi:hypothetical protein
MEEEVVYKLCKRGHVKSPDNVYKDGHCRACRITYQSEYSKSNRAKISKQQLQWANKNKERVKERSDKYRLNNAEKIKIKRANNIDKIRQRNRKSNAKSVEILSNAYVALKMKISVVLLSPELIELKRNRLLEIRALRELKKAIGG